MRGCCCCCCLNLAFLPFYHCRSALCLRRSGEILAFRRCVFGRALSAISVQYFKSGASSLLHKSYLQSDLQQQQQQHLCLQLIASLCQLFFFLLSVSLSEFVDIIVSSVCLSLCHRLIDERAKSEPDAGEHHQPSQSVNE